MLPDDGRLLFLWLGLHPCETETSSIISSPVKIYSFSPSSSLVRILKNSHWQGSFKCSVRSQVA